jgi:hypothetical protein
MITRHSVHNIFTAAALCDSKTQNGSTTESNRKEYTVWLGAILSNLQQNRRALTSEIQKSSPVTGSATGESTLPPHHGNRWLRIHRRHKQASVAIRGWQENHRPVAHNLAVSEEILCGDRV